MKLYGNIIAAGLILLSAPLPAFAQNAPAAANAVPGPGELRPYRINPGDELEVYVWGEERLQRVIRVLPDGTFSFPLVGRVDALNKLPTDIEGVISKGLEAQYRGQVPQVTVSVRAPSGLQVSVIGKVRSPGSFTPGKYINVLEAIGIAGGPTEFADVSNVTILRKQGDRLTPMKVRLTDALRGSPSARDLGANGLPQLQSGDTVIVP
ncbi:polysaccharide export outer membrane protein [Sphingomonas laterariae]|uniref:Polysaccharide export outer membrane protein n=1 Tax=Edaphosphingomonas laterariae TaxID=861865 RepID=A0A239HRB9_9SPHN|nr:polysaccharide biosynthesis/export family protein [Sphingomonas laterariae]SNS83741.1 polysaccharide export outer membrane protein [Sphingomonas laterariae]